MRARKIVLEIIKRWNSGDKDGARKLFFLSQWVLPEVTKEALKDKMKCNLNRNPKLDKTLKMCCDIIGGKIIEDGVDIYKN